LINHSNGSHRLRFRFDVVLKTTPSGGISFAFIDKVIPDLANAVKTNLLIGSWYFFAGVIFISLVAHFISIMANRWAIVHDCNESVFDKIRNRWNFAVRTINIMMIIGLLLGIVLLIRFVNLNI